MASVRELLQLDGRVALVVGSGHLGGVASDALAELGASVAVADLNLPAAEKAAARALDLGSPDTVALAVDAADEASVAALPAQVAQRLGGLDIIVHTAAYVGTTALEGWAVPFEQQSVSTWRDSLEVNLTSAFVLVQQAAPLLRRHRVGSVVLFGSIYGCVGPDLRLYEGTGLGNPAAYAGAKGGLVQLTRWLATALAPDIRVNLVSPGGVRRGQDAAFVERYESRTPLRRMAEDEDVKGAVAYLAGDAASYVTGHNLLVDGGWTAW